MAITNSVINPHLDDFEKCTGQRPANFVCPILREEAPLVELTRGHILPDGLKESTGEKVIQLSKVDNMFGHTIEPSQIKFLNSVALTREELIQQGNPKLLGNDGQLFDTFIPNPKSKPQNPRIRLHDKDREIASPYVKGNLKDVINDNGNSELQVEIPCHKASVDGAMLKSAFLALFRNCGYGWAFSPSGRYIAEPLKQFFNSDRNESSAGHSFGAWANAMQVQLKGAQLPFNTINDEMVLLHDQSNSTNSLDPFAVSCVFKINGRTILVTLPFSMNGTDFENCLKVYYCLMNDRRMPHRIISAVWNKRQFDAEDVISHQFLEAPPDELIPDNRSASE